MSHKEHLIMETVLGTASGIYTGLSKQMDAQHLHGVAKLCSKFFHHATRSLVQNKKITGAAAAGTIAAAPTVGPVLVAAAPFVAGAAVIAGASYGAYKLVELVREVNHDVRMKASQDPVTTRK